MGDESTNIEMTQRVTNSSVHFAACIKIHKELGFALFKGELGRSCAFTLQWGKDRDNKWEQGEIIIILGLAARFACHYSRVYMYVHWYSLLFSPSRQCDAPQRLRDSARSNFPLLHFTSLLALKLSLSVWQ